MLLTVLSFIFCVFSLVGIRDLGGVGGGVDMYRVSGATKTQITICSSLYLFPNNPLVSHCSWDKDTPKILCNSCAVLKFYRWMMWLISPQCYSSDDVRVLENSLMEEKCLDVGLFSFAVDALTMFIYIYIHTFFLFSIYYIHDIWIFGSCSNLHTHFLTMIGGWFGVISCNSLQVLF